MPCLLRHSLENMDSASRPNPKHLRGRLLITGHTVESFAVRHGFNTRTVKAAIRGERGGPLSQEILKRIHQVTRHVA